MITNPIPEIDMTERLYGYRLSEPMSPRPIAMRDIIVNIKLMEVQEYVESSLKEINLLIGKLDTIERVVPSFDTDITVYKNQHNEITKVIIDKLRSSYAKLKELNLSDPMDKNIYMMLNEKIKTTIIFVNSKHEKYVNSENDRDKRINEYFHDSVDSRNDRDSVDNNNLEQGLLIHDNNLHNNDQAQTAIVDLAQEIQSLNTMMKDLYMMVIEQQPLINQIETNIVASCQHVEEGVKELGKAEKYQQSYRKKLICILVIVFVIIIVISIVLGVSLS